jgi:ribose transport system substrate-binding protein
MPASRSLSALTLILVIASSCLLVSCGNTQKSKTAKTIGVTLKNRSHIFYKDLEEGLKEQAAKEGFELIITSADEELGRQISQIEDFITRKVDAIVICPADSRGIGVGVQKAKEAGIPVFTADIAAENAEVIAHIASDNISGGRLAGEKIAALLGGKGKVAIINEPTVTSVLDRVKGFREALGKFPDITIVADVNGQGKLDKAQPAAEDVLQGHPDLNGIFGINDDSALGALAAAEQLNRKDLVIIGYDATPPAVEAIRRGSPLKAEVTQDPKKIGSITIETIRDFLAGKQVPKTIPVGVSVVE